MTVWRFNYFDKKFEAKAEDLFELPIQPECEIPAEWLEKVKVGVQSYQGNVRTVNGNGRNWDHLKQYQYKPGMGNGRNSYQGGDLGEFFGHDFEEIGDDTLDALMGINAKPSSGSVWRYDPKEAASKERALAIITEDPTMEEAGDSHLGKSEEGVEPRSLAPGFTDGRYEDISAIHGTEVADAWYAIDTEMSALEGKDELNAELICDMFHLSSEEGQLKLIQDLYQELSPRMREKIETHGI